MDKVDYVGEANRQLADERFYKKLDSDPTVLVYNDVTSIETRMVAGSFEDKQ
jgi:hypothetical protein